VHCRTPPGRLYQKKNNQYPQIASKKRDCLQIARELVNKSLDAADQADVKRQALIILNEESVNYLQFLRGQVHTDGNTLIPAC
jgi:DNA topoisomerase VI subunit B